MLTLQCPLHPYTYPYGHLPTEVVFCHVMPWISLQVGAFKTATNTTFAMNLDGNVPEKCQYLKNAPLM